MKAPSPAGGMLQRSVLVVDDNDLFRTAMECLLATMGRPSVLAASGEEALALLEAGLRPSIVLLDMDMPGLGGPGTLLRLRALQPDLPVLVCTGRVTDAARAMVRHHGARILPKPFGFAELEAKLAEIEGEDG